MRKDVYHMIDWLKAHADVEEIDYETSFSKALRHFEPMNVSNSIANMKLRIPESITRTSRSATCPSPSSYLS